ncbi:SMP-30/gluconolactonase/LRE family protein [Streptomyces sp. NPDC085932]|uniref:SMP-30/gluconolactonase/LRE family protein n=1 Tax=Streptomyces sp. NPDC085932 TaxID=3365741 RepID=UPI0037D69F6C
MSPHLIRTPLPRAVLGESPRFDAESRTVSWVDLAAGRLWLAPVHPHGSLDHWVSCADPVTEVPGPLSCAVRAQGGTWLLVTGGSVLRWQPGEAASVLAELEAFPEHAQLNDGAVDAAGRFWIGSMCARRPLQPRGRLHVLDGDGQHMRTSTVLDGLLAANGIGWSPDGTTAYVVDSGRRVIRRLRPGVEDMLEDAGPPLAVPVGVPDGLAVDSEGCLWVALWDGWCVVRLSPEGDELTRIPLPCSRPTACTLIGSRLLITTATVTGEAGSGWIYAAEVEVQGGPAAQRACVPG